MSGGKKYLDELQLTVALPVSSGGTGATTSQGARESIGSPWVVDQDWPEGVTQAGNTIQQRYIAPFAVELGTLRVSMETVNTQGNYTLVVTNLSTGNTMLSAANFNMNSLSAGTPGVVARTGTAADRQLNAGDRFLVQLASDDASFDGSGTFLSFSFFQRAA